MVRAFVPRVLVGCPLCAPPPAHDARRRPRLVLGTLYALPFPFTKIFAIFSFHFVLQRWCASTSLDETYIAVDRRYQDLNDGFNIAQAWYEILNIKYYYLLFISRAATKLKRATRTSFVLYRQLHQDEPV